MRKLKHIIAIIIVLFVVVGTCVFILPRISSTDSSSSESSSAEIAAQDTTVVEDTLSFADKFKQELQVIQESYSKDKSLHVDSRTWPNHNSLSTSGKTFRRENGWTDSFNGRSTQ